MAKITLGDIQVDVVRKNIKHIHLSVYPPAGRARISAPEHMSLENLKRFALSKLDWIRRQQEKMKSLEREPQKEYLDRETHYYLGGRYTLKVKDHQAAAGVQVHADLMEVRMRGDASPAKVKKTLMNWYRDRLRELAAELIKKWEPVLGVKTAELGIKTMKTRWGTCNPRARRIWLNLELIKQPKEYLAYVVVHEMAHLLVRNHGLGFKKLMDKHVPQWKLYRRELRRIQL